MHTRRFSGATYTDVRVFGNFRIYCRQNCTNSINRSCNLIDVGGLMFLWPSFILTTHGAIFPVVTFLTKYSLVGGRMGHHTNESFCFL